MSIYCDLKTTLIQCLSVIQYFNKDLILLITKVIFGYASLTVGKNSALSSLSTADMYSHENVAVSMLRGERKTTIHRLNFRDFLFLFIGLIDPYLNKEDGKFIYFNARLISWNIKKMKPIRPIYFFC